MAPIQVFLKTLNGSTAVLSNVETASDLHTAAASAEKLPASVLRLTHASRDIPVGSRATLADLGLVSGSNVFSLVRLLGGGKKRKKKTYTKPKKIKHKHKTVKLAVLKYYKIDGDGKIERLRKECPADTCGAGVFMASHSDRLYCGKCGLTFVP